MESTATKLHDLMAANLKIHKEQVKIMRKGNRVMATVTIALALTVAGSLAGGWWMLQRMQEQSAETLEIMKQSVITRI